MGNKKNKKRKSKHGRTWRVINGKMTEITEAVVSKVSEVAAHVKVRDAVSCSLVIPHDVHQKILYWMTKSTNEVSGYGSLEFDEKENKYTVKDVILLKQSVTATSTELDAAAIGKAMFQMRDEPMGMKWHWHTHPNMGVFWSQDDLDVIYQHGQQGWILASVFNEKHEVKTAFCTTTKVLEKDHDIFVDDIPTTIVSFYPHEFFTKLDKEYDECVTPEVRTFYMGEWNDKDGNRWEPGSVWDATEKRWVKDDTVEDDLIPDDNGKLVYDKWGYARTTNGHYIYNPLHDTSLTTQPEVAKAIKEDMQPWEIRLLNQYDPDFRKFHATLEKGGA